MKLNRVIVLLIFISAFQVLVYGQEPNTNTGNTKSAVNYSPEQEYFFDIIQNRRSVRNFKSTPIPEEHISKIIDMARMAPTSGNQQPWKFLVVQDRNKINELKSACINTFLQYQMKDKEMTEKEIEDFKTKWDARLSGYLNAPVFIAVLTDSNSVYPSYNVKDVSLAAENIMLAARALGYGSVFCTDIFPFNVVQKTLNIPMNYEIICTIPIGIPEKWPDAPKKKSLDEVVVYEKF